MVTAEIIDLNVYSIPWDKILGIYLNPSIDPCINTICTSHMPEFVYSTCGMLIGGRGLDKSM